MKTKLLSALLALAAALLPAVKAQQDQASAATTELNALVARIQEKIRAGKKSPADLAPEAAEFATLRARHETANPAGAAKIAEREYSFFREVVKDMKKAAAVRAELMTKYRPYITSVRLTEELMMEDEMKRIRQVQADAVGKPAAELKFIWSTERGLAKLSDLKGKVVVLDFWATWCGPCIATFPQIRELAEHYKESDVVIVGVTSVQGYVMGLEPARIDTKGDPEREFALMPAFMKAKGMTWPVVFSEQPVSNPDYGVRGIPHMAIIAPDGTLRHNGLHPGMPRSEKLAKIDALLKEFGKAVPAAAHK